MNIYGQYGVSKGRMIKITGNSLGIGTGCLQKLRVLPLH